VNGKHYQKTLEEWLRRLDGSKRQLWPVLEATYGKGQARKWHFYWRLFNMACSELFGYSGGNEWFVAHYLFAKPPAAA